MSASAILKTLRQVHIDLINLRGGGGQYKHRVVDYQMFSDRAAHALGNVVTTATVEGIVLTPRHRVLQQYAFTPSSGDPSQHVEAEAVDRLRLVESILSAMQAIEQAAAAINGVLIAPDTNFFLHGEQGFDDVDWLALADASAVHLLVPRVARRSASTSTITP